MLTGLPDATDHVVIPVGDNVTIDPALSSVSVSIASLLIEDGAELITLPGTLLTVSGNVVLENGSVDARDSQISLDQLVIPPEPVGGFGFGSGGVRLNPTTKDMREILAAYPEYTFSFGLAGTTPASAGNVGAGFMRH